MLACEFWVHVGERPARVGPLKPQLQPVERAQAVAIGGASEVEQWTLQKSRLLDVIYSIRNGARLRYRRTHDGLLTSAVMRDIPGARAKVFAKLLICASEDLHFPLRTASSEGGGSGAKVLFLFADHTLATDRRELVRGSAPIAVEPQVFDLLVHLMRNRNRVVSKDDLIASVWGGRIVSEATLASRINAARKAVGDSGAEQRVIRTLSRKGFRFVGDVRVQSGEEQTPVDPPRNGYPERSPALPLPDRPAIAVLPFTNMSDDPEQDYFSDGISEDIIAALSKLRWFFVIARNSSFT